MLSKFNTFENFKIEYFPEKKVEIVKFYIDNLYKDDFDLEFMPGISSILNWDLEDNIKYYFNLFPDVIPEHIREDMLKKIKSNGSSISPRLHVYFVTKRKNIEQISNLLNEMSNLTQILEDEGLHCKISPNLDDKGNGEEYSGYSFINIYITL